MFGHSSNRNLKIGQRKGLHCPVLLPKIGRKGCSEGFETCTKVSREGKARRGDKGHPWVLLMGWAAFREHY